jgi:hypothetical protein
MKNIKNNQQIEKAAGQNAVTMKTSKETLANLNEERWLSPPNKSIKSQTYELGRHKRTW